MLQDPKHILRDLWGHTDFRGSQKAVIDTVMAGQDVLALLPTGGGKSICYQVPTMAREGICIVVSPLVALIKDQTASLKKKGIKAIGLSGGISENEMIDLLDNCVFGNYKFLYLSPERLLHPMVRNRIPEMPVSLIAIDEAHCISQWGHDFRPAYLQCALLRELAPGVPILALTATATQQVAHDIVESLQLKEPVLFKDSLERRNITFSVTHTNDKRYELARLCAGVKDSGIVYVRSRRSSIALAQYLVKKGVGALFFHGGLSQGEKSDRLNAWLHNEVPIMVATNAFGMGIDKPDVELVVHYQTPDCLENYYQEAGRAGRNQKPARAVLLHAPVDAQHAKGQFLSALPNVQDIKKIYKKLHANFQIAYGEGQGTSHGFNFNAFCDHYGLARGKTYNALRILDQNSVIALSEEFSKKTTVHCPVDKTTLFTYLEKKPDTARVFQTLLRTYGGIFDFDTTINTHLIAKKVQKGENYVVEVLQRMK
ncbi:MAG: ATP-dependent DNA helicase RecQ, partial [Flavobacteriaceae bacterium]